MWPTFRRELPRKPNDAGLGGRMSRLAQACVTSKMMSSSLRMEKSHNSRVISAKGAKSVAPALLYSTFQAAERFYAPIDPGARGLGGGEICRPAVGSVAVCPEYLRLLFRGAFLDVATDDGGAN